MKLPAPIPVLPTVELFGATDTGRTRSNNEDAVALEEGAALAVLADDLRAIESMLAADVKM